MFLFIKVHPIYFMDPILPFYYHISCRFYISDYYKSKQLPFDDFTAGKLFADGFLLYIFCFLS